MSTPREPASSAVPGSSFDRRTLLRRGAAGALAASLASSLPRGWAAPAYASDAPELSEVSIGIVAVQSCASIVIAHEKGLFKKHGLTSKLSKENGWAAARDKLVSGENHATHLKYAQSFAATVGLQGAPKTPILAPFTLSRNGSVFMADLKLKGKLTTDPKTWKATAEEYRAKGESFTIALPIPPGFHGLMYRYFLANAGVNADKELKLITLPPAQMVQNLRVGTMQACAMVEPWGTRGVAEKVTFIVMYGHEMWVDHPVKTFALMERFAEEKPKTARAMLRALHEAAVWCDKDENHEELARILAAPSYMNSPAGTILPGLRGEFDWGDGRKQTDRRHAISYSRDNYPQLREGKWFLSQFRRWGMLEGEPDYDAVARQVTRPELYTEAMKELGFTGFAPNDAPIEFFDGKSFDHKQTAAYARSFAVHSLKG